MNFISPSFRANERSATNQSREASSRVFTRWRMSSLLLPRAVARERCELGSAEDLIMLGRGKRGKFDENFSTNFCKIFCSRALSRRLVELVEAFIGSVFLSVFISRKISRI